MPYTLITVFFCAVCAICSAQTTLEEYNYITKGLRVQQDSGLDMKAGYKIQYADERFKDTNWQEPVYHATNTPFYLQKLVRLKDNSIAAYILVAHGTYHAVPSPASNDEVIKLFTDKLTAWRRADDCVYLENLTRLMWEAAAWK